MEIIPLGKSAKKIPKEYAADGEEDGDYVIRREPPYVKEGYILAYGRVYPQGVTLEDIKKNLTEINNKIMSRDNRTLVHGKFIDGSDEWKIVEGRDWLTSRFFIRNARVYPKRNTEVSSTGVTINSEFFTWFQYNQKRPIKCRKLMIEAGLLDFDKIVFRNGAWQPCPGFSGSTSPFYVSYVVNDKDATEILLAYDRSE